MGLDLYLLPIESETVHFSHTVLNCQRRPDLFKELLSIPSEPVSQYFSTFLSRGEDGEHCYGKTTTTPYGQALTWVRLESLLLYRDHIDVRDNSRNRAIWAYLGELPPFTKIALYWH